MTQLTLTTAAIAIAAAAFTGSDYDRTYIDEPADNVSLSFMRIVVGGFHRMFNHQPYAAQTSGTAPVDQDPVEVAFRARLQYDAENTRLAAANFGSRLE